MCGRLRYQAEKGDVEMEQRSKVLTGNSGSEKGVGGERRQCRSG